MTDFYIKIGSKLRKCRMRAGLTQSDMARKLGLTFQQVQKYERGVNRIPLDAMLIYLQECDVHLSDFMAMRHAQEETRNRATLDLMARFNQLHPDKQKAVLTLVKSL